MYITLKIITLLMFCKDMYNYLSNDLFIILSVHFLLSFILVESSFIFMR